MQIRDEYELKRNITLALQKAHFGDYEIAIRLLIDIIEYQQKQINKLLTIDEMKTEAAKFIKENYNIERKLPRPMTMEQLENDPLDKGKQYIKEKYGEDNDET